MIKLIATDMDGTLLNDDHAAVSQRNVDALRRAAEQGIEVVISSGRPWSLLKEIADRVGVVRYVVASNGAAVLDRKTGEWLLQREMPKEQVRKMVEILFRYGAGFELFCEGQNYVDRRYEELVVKEAPSPEYLDMFRRQALIVDDLQPLIEEKMVEKLYVFHVEPGTREKIEEELQATGPYESACAYAFNMEITAPGVDKGEALKVLCGKLGIDASEVMAFGDADNDLGMLSWAGWSFAMGNGTDKAKAAAKYVTGTNSDSGVAQGVERYALEQQN